MKQGQGSKRTRGRSNSRRSGNRQNLFDSNGPSVRIRGNAFQVHEKYLGLARDATSSGDRIAAENYYQHAEHYFRIHSADLEERNQRQGVNGQAAEGQRQSDGQRHQGGRDPRANGRNVANGDDAGQAQNGNQAQVQNGNQAQAEIQPQTEIELPEPPVVEAAPPKPRRRKPAASKGSRRPATTNGGDTPAGD